MYKIRILKKVQKNLRKIPSEVQMLFQALLIDLEEDGPEQPSWPNYSKLGKNKYHCHLNYRYVACWTCENGTLTIEVYYAGSREKAPY